MAIKTNNGNISKMYFGTSEVKKVYVGTVQIYPVGYTLSFNSFVVFDFFAETNTQTIPQNSTLHITVTSFFGNSEIYWDKNGTSTLAWDGSSYSTRTLSFSTSDSLKFIFLAFFSTAGVVTLRLNDASGDIVSTFSYELYP